MINIRKGFLQGDSYSPVVSVSMLTEETVGYRVECREKERAKRTHDLFIDDLTIYPVSHQKLEAVNEMIVKASIDTEACYGVKK